MEAKVNELESQVMMLKSEVNRLRSYVDMFDRVFDGWSPHYTNLKARFNCNGYHD